MYFFGIAGSLVLVMGAWLVITGRSLPGWLGRGLTEGDRTRIQRTPAQFYRAAGTLSVLGGLFAFVCVWLISLFPEPSVTSLLFFAALSIVFVALIGAALAWTLVIGERHRLFRWHKP